MVVLTLVSAFLFIFFLTLINQNDSPEAEGEENKGSGSISGRITIKGKPAAGFELALFIYDAIPEKTIAKAATDENGGYQFTNLSANHYWVKVLAPQYITSGEYDDEGPRRRVSIADGESADGANFDLFLGGAISGKIVDIDGEPVVNEWVKLYVVYDNHVDGQAYWLNDRVRNDEDEPFWLNQNAETDAQGNYRLYGIPAGRYRVAAGVNLAKKRWKSPEKGGSASFGFIMVGGHRCYEETFYGNVRDRAKAKIIEISLAKELQGIDIRMPDKGLPVYNVSGRIIEEETGKPRSGCNVLIESLNGGGYVTHKLTDENGGFEIGGLLKGRYFVDTYLDDKIELVTDRVDFEIKDENVTGLEIKARPGLTMTGSIVIEDGNTRQAIEKLSQLGFRVSSSKILMGRKAIINSDGNFTFTGLYKGTLSFESLPKHFSLVRVEHPNARYKLIIPSYGKWLVEMADEDLTGVRIVLTYKSGAVKGRVNIIYGRLPLGMILRASIYRQCETGSWSTEEGVDANGNFQIEGLEPGEYGISIRWSMPRINIGPILGGGMNGLTESQRVKVTTDSEVDVTFTINASELNKQG